ncbi:YncE family protein [Mycolicibacterium arabiense]|uniref:YncE family protein n=2 Tax=Mycobacteriaceae TaxID=1762 RepID=UPI0013D27B29
MPFHRNLRRRLFHAAIAGVTVVAVGACSSDPVEAPPPTITPATAADSPPAAAPPAGEVRTIDGPGLTTVFDRATSSLVVLTGTGSNGSTLAVFPTTGAARTVTLPTPASSLAGDGDGTVYAAVRGGYVRLALAGDVVTPFEVEGAADVDFTAITRRGDGRLTLGTADGAVYTLESDIAVAARLQIFARVDGLAAQGDTVVVLDRGQTSVTTVDPSGDDAGQALRAGEGATTIAADPAGRVLVADTRGGALLVFGADPLILRQRYPVGGAPYGLAGSARLAWVSETATNTVVGYDLATGIPVEKVRYSTVRQPNSLAYDEESNTLFVVSGSGAGVQVIKEAAR